MARGRPRIKIDYKQVEQLAAMQCTDEEIAAVLGVERSTIKRRKKDDDEFCTAYKKGKERGKASLRRMQFKAAEGGNATMLIWLGKQYLGQSDKTQQEISGPAGKPVQMQVDLSHLSEEELRVLESITKRLEKTAE